MTAATPGSTRPIPALLREARGVYAHAIGTRLAEAGYADLPQNGPWILGGLGRRGESLATLSAELGVSKQAASQLIDVLVQRGYLVSDISTLDRRRRALSLTARGASALAAVTRGIDEVDAALAELVSARDLVGLRRGLTALGTIRGTQSS